MILPLGEMIHQWEQWSPPHMRAMDSLTRGTDPSLWDPHSPGLDYTIPFSLLLMVLIFTAIIFPQNRTHTILEDTCDLSRQVAAGRRWRSLQSRALPVAPSLATSWLHPIFPHFPLQSVQGQEGAKEGGSVCEAPTTPPVFWAPSLPGGGYYHSLAGGGVALSLFSNKT